MSSLLFCLFVAVSGSAGFGVGGATASPAFVPALSPVEAAVVQAAGPLPAGLAVTEVILPRRFSLRAGVQLVVQWKTPPRPGLVGVQVRLQRGSKVLRKAWARLRLEALAPVARLRIDAPAGHVLRAADFEISSGVTSGGAANPFALTGARLLQPLRAGQIVTQENVSLAPPVERGARLQVVSQHGPVVIRAQGVLERRTRLGEQATVMLLPPQRKRVQGQLMDERTVLIGGVP